MLLFVADDRSEHGGVRVAFRAGEPEPDVVAEVAVRVVGHLLAVLAGGVARLHLVPALAHRRVRLGAQGLVAAIPPRPAILVAVAAREANDRARAGKEKKGRQGKEHVP